MKYFTHSPLVATVRPTDATGTVYFYDNNTAFLGSVPPSNGVATLAITPAGGKHNYTAVYLEEDSGHVDYAFAFLTLTVATPPPAP